MNKTILAIGITILFIGMSFNSISGIQIDNNIIIPTNRGNILYVGGNGSGNYTKIQDAIDNASDGDTVFVYDDSSPYYEDIVVDKSLNLIGENRDTTVIRHLYYSSAVEITVDWVNVSGFSIVDSSIGVNANETTSNIKISDNHFIDCIIGIFLRSDDSFIISNSFSLCDWASIYIDDWYGCDNITISNNFINSTSQEISELLGDITAFVGGKNYAITNNTLIRSKSNEYRVGIWLRGLDDSIIEDNKFIGYTGWAIEFSESNSNNIISHNNFTNNDLGITFNLGSTSNRIINNNFINNGHDASSLSLSYNNRWDGNYWDEWIGLRYKLPIFQRFPKIIRGGLFSFGIDWHPAKEPYDI